MGLFCDLHHHLAPEHLVLEPPGSAAHRQLGIYLTRHEPSLSWLWPVLAASSSFRYRILMKQQLFLLQIGYGSLYYLIICLRVASSPCMLAPVSVSCHTHPPYKGLLWYTQSVMSVNNYFFDLSIYFSISP